MAGGFLSTYHDELSQIAHDPLVQATSTHSERYRAAKADMAEDDMAEDERDMRRRMLLPREPVHQILMCWSARLAMIFERKSAMTLVTCC